MSETPSATPPEPIPPTLNLVAATPLAAAESPELPACSTAPETRPPDEESGTDSLAKTPATRLTTDPARPADGSQRAPRSIPIRVGNYEVCGVLGRGGMGVVYQATHLTLKRVVALKMILAGRHAGPEQLARFRAEGEAAARLQHPNIVQIYEVGEEDGCPFFSLELVAGGSLDRRLAGQPQAPAAAARLVATLASAMHCAHQKGIIHRDLKPANVLLAADGTPKIGDFGLAKRLDEETRTHSGAIMGTPHYMSPEQAEGRIKDVDARSDVWALGAILYECLTGMPPFRGDSVADTLDQVRSREPLLPSRLNPKVPPDLSTICLKCLRKEPGQRYASAQHLADDLGAYLEGRPIVARPVPAWERVLKWARRRPAQAALAVTLLLLLLGGVAGAVFYGHFQDSKANAYKKEVELQSKEVELQKKKLRRLGQAEELRARGQQAEDAGRPTEAEGRYREALGILADEADDAATIPRRRIEERLLELRKRRDLDEQERKASAEKQQLLDRIKQLDKDRGAILPREMGVTEAEADANRAFLRQAIPAALKRFGVPVSPATSAQAQADARRAFLGKAADLLNRSRKVIEPKEGSRLAAAVFELLLVWAEAEATPPYRQGTGPREAGREAERLLNLAAALGEANQLTAPQAFHQRRARYRELLGDRPGTVADLRAARQARPNTALDYFLTALDHHSRGQFEQAARACGNALVKQPGHFWAQFLQGVCNLRRGRWAEARAGLNTCVLEQPELPWPYLMRAAASSGLGEFLAANEDFTKAETLARGNKFDTWVILVNRGLMRIRQQRRRDLLLLAARMPTLPASPLTAGPLPLAAALPIAPPSPGWDNAIADLKEATKLLPNGYLAYASLARAYQGRGDLDAALEALSRALCLREDAALYHQLARLHMVRKDRAAAYCAFEEVAERAVGRNQRANAYVELSYLHDDDGNLESALACAAAALRVAPGYLPAERQAARVLVEQARAAEAKLLRGAGPKDVKAIRLLYGEAGAALDRYLKTVPSPQLFCARARIHIQLGEFPSALRACDRALSLKEDVSSRNLHGWIYLKMELAQPALRDFEAVLKLDARHSDALCGRGLARVTLGEVPQGIADAKAALIHSGKTRRLLVKAACVYARAATRLQTSRRSPANSPAARGGRELPVGSLAREFALGPAADLRAAEEYQGRAVELLRDALARVPEQARAVFWRETVLDEPALFALRHHAGMQRLARIYVP